MTTTIAYADVAGLAGTDLGYTDWLEITQDRVEPVRRRDRRPPVDPRRPRARGSRARSAPRSPTASSRSRSRCKFWTELLDVEGVTTKVNYGLDKVRFISPGQGRRRGCG